VESKMVWKLYINISIRFGVAVEPVQPWEKWKFDSHKLTSVCVVNYDISMELRVFMQQTTLCYESDVAMSTGHIWEDE